MIRKVLLVLLLLCVITSFFGCQTVQGIGEDIKWTGEKTAELLEEM